MSPVKAISQSLHITVKGRSFQFSPYNHEAHHGQLNALCRNVYNGRDVVPHMAISFSCDPQCAPYVLCGTMGVAAFVNLRLREQNPHGQPRNVLVLVDSLRVREDLRGCGLATATMSAIEHVVQSTFQPRHTHVRTACFLSVTNPANTAMRNVFHKLKWCSHQTMYVWPIIDVVQDAQMRDTSLFNALNLSQFITDQVRTLSQQWTSIQNAEQILNIMKLLHKRGASNYRPLYYDTESAECASQFLKHHLAAKEERSVWCLDVHGQVQGLLFVRAKILDPSEPCRCSLFSACVTNMQAAESCVVLATERLCINYFHFVFDAPISSHRISESRMLSCAAGDSFVIYRREVDIGTAI
ncbi:unnamed protein product [Agarophyton chilense]|eukprot:gb/GEZJ01005535.1/.p1 GENE.gb/GEZJ01005535.1/~~gb/GEZJ01005535.1/.p1  ORF type:complete len:355 (-),score=20.90 gb/GEZJ01005535.1/:579-1643(-)